MSKTNDGPRAIIHQNILEAARDDPDASLEELAAQVSGATIDLVERVLEQYGDPMDDGNPGDESVLSMGDFDGIPISELTETQRETLEVIAANPEATQREIGSMLGISGPSVNRRVSSIPGFEWSNRAAIVEQLFDPDVGMSTSMEKFENGNTTGDEKSGEEPTNEQEDPPTLDTGARPELTAEMLTEIESRLDQIDARLSKVEERNSEGTPRSSPFTDSTLVHKVVHACLESDRITEEEEVRILDEIINGSPSGSSSER